MGIRITRGAGLDIRLEKIAERSSRQLRRVHRDASYAAADTAKQMAPVLREDLEMSIGVQETREVGNRKVFTIQAEAPHAKYMHEGIYDLGPRSRAKDESGQHAVGRKFIERALEWLHRDWGFRQKLANAMKEGKK